MEEILVREKTLPQAYHAALRALRERGEDADCADWGQRQREVSMTMVVEQPLAEPMISRLFIGDPKSLEQYRQEMLDGILDFEVDRGNWAYTYHRRMAEHGQLDFVLEDLRRSPGSRRAVMVIRAPEDIGSEDPACLQHVQYFLRGGKLYCKVLFRSNDACKATFMNAFALILLQKRFADALGVEMGSYTHRANSFHVYEKDYAMLDGYVARMDEAEDEEELTYEYEDGWDALMEMYRPEIAQAVEDLKKR